MSRTNSAAKLALIAATISLSGCGAYLHRPALETATSKLKTDFEAMQAPAYLAEQEKRLAAFATEEDRALIGYLTASRDYSLLNVLRPSAGSTIKVTPSEGLHDAVKFELNRLTGTSVLTEGDSKKLQTARYIAASMHRVAPFFADQLEFRTRVYNDRGGKLKTDCVSVLGRNAPSNEAPDTARAYRQIGWICAAIERDKARVPQCDFNLKGEIERVCSRIASSDADKKKKRIEEMGKAIAALNALANPPEPEQATAEIRALLEEANDAISAVSNLSDNEKYARVFAALNKAFGIDLANSLREVGELPKGKKAARAKQGLLAALQAIDAIDQFTAPHGTPLDQPSALLIGIAKTQHELNLVKIELDEEKTLVAIFQQETAAIGHALHFLARAQDILCPGNAPCQPRRSDLSQPAVAEALGYYLNAYNGGIIPFEVLQFREIQVKRASAVRRAKAAEADYRALVQPAIEMVHARGEGGIKPEHLAPILGGLPPAGAFLVK